MDPREAFLGRVASGELSWREIEYLARLLNKVRVSEDGCWIWTGTIRQGYGVASIPRPAGSGHKKQGAAHRIVWMLFTGQELGDLTIDHLCQQRPCVNPDHLEAVTLEENVRRGWSAESVARRNRNRDKNCCPLGHPYDENNTYRDGRGGRKCRTCIRERQARRRAADPELMKEIKRRSYHRNKGDRLPPTGARTHCPRGHPYDEENTYVIPSSGGRVCRTCARERQRRVIPRSVGR